MRLALALALCDATAAAGDAKAPLGFSVREGHVDAAGRTLRFTGLVPDGAPPTAGFPLILRVGYPGKEWQPIAGLLEIRRHLHAEPAALAITDVLDPAPDEMVDAPGMLARVPPRFHALVDEIERSLPIDPDRVYLTGFSFDAVWAWMLGFSEPDRYAAVAALSAVSYPAPIAGRVENGANLPVCVLRAERDHMYPRRLAQERATGELLGRLNPESRFLILPAMTHTDVWKAASACLDALLEHRRDRWPAHVVKTIFAPDERDAYWLRVEAFARTLPVDWQHAIARVGASVRGDSIHVAADNVRTLRVIPGGPWARSEPWRLVVNGREWAERLPARGGIIDVAGTRVGDAP